MVEEKIVPKNMETGEKLLNYTPCPECGMSDWEKVFTLPTGTKGRGFETPSRKD